MVKKKRRLKLKKKNVLMLFVFIMLVYISFIGINNSEINDSKIVIGKEPEIVGPVIKESNISLIMVGDCLIHQPIYDVARRGDGTYSFEDMFTNIKPIIKSYDLAFYNQESILGGKEMGLSTYPRFNSPTEVGDAFIDMGFNLVSLANNHTLDRGEKAITNSLNYWNSKEDILTAGSYLSFEDRDKVNIMTKNDISYTLLSYTTTTNGLRVPVGKDYLLNVWNEELVKADIERARDKVDIVIVAMHWGVEYVHYPNYEQKDIAAKLAEYGADIVIGHHPHVVQPIEFIGDTLIIYSLGNFISSQIGIERLTGLMASVNIKKVDTDGEVEITLEDVSAELVYTKKTPRSGGYYYKLYPYSQIDDSILGNKNTYYDKYMKVVTSIDQSIILK